jgi:flagellar biosynthesis GTPase FlhF
MQLTLSSTPFAKPAVASRPAPQRPHDAAALSQLDQIAAQNLQASRHGLGGAAMFLALVGGLVVLGSASMWSSGTDEPRKPAVAAEQGAAPVMQAPVAAVAEMVAVAPSAAAAVASPAAAETTAEQPVVAVAEPVAVADDAARKARAKQQAEARRKAAQVAQERALAEETQRLQLAQQREAERAQQLADQARQRAAAEQARLAATQLASDSRRNVGDMCSAAGGFVSQQFCHARECRKAEHQGDGICVNLRETEAARLRASAER